MKKLLQLLGIEEKRKPSLIAHHIVNTTYGNWLTRFTYNNRIQRYYYELYSL